MRPLPRFLRTSFVVLFCLVAAGPVLTYPPAPHYTIYGLVRDQVGTTLRVEGAQLILLRDGAEIGRAPISSTVVGDYNYELRIRIDQARPSSRTYTPRAVAAQGLFSVVVEMNGERFYPIEVNGTLRTGHGGERVRLDLNLGADTDLDGLPDAWEEWQLHQAGYVRGASGWDLTLLHRDGDFDRDGTSDYLEYLAGTFAGDVTERFELKLVAKSGPALAFEFFAITGKIYSIEESGDLQVWTPAAFSLTPGGTALNTFLAAAVGVQPAYLLAAPGVARFYRLVVR